jgi:ArsR family transcriptional regulator
MVVDMSMPAPPLNARDAAAVKVAKALADPTRFQLLRAIATRPEVSCQELVARFPLAQATISHHLKVLSEAGLVSVRKEGAFHHYRAVPEALDAHVRVLAGAFRAARSRGAPRGRALRDGA